MITGIVLAIAFGAWLFFIQLKRLKASLTILPSAWHQKK